ncbi:hypothetical protein ACGFX4_13360 [Kitasatospora sp. NPDC048365]|uniref:hypothetical protein n=1 Tax=Kitasatospora sp. NPDC048365 TaxID=3364050 RepID=UPI003715EB64
MADLTEAAEDARRYDRPRITDVSDIWDNNSRPLFAAVCGRTAWGRRRMARRALVWMAALGESRRAWMVEQAALAGHDLSWLPVPAPSGPYRDTYGNLWPQAVPYTPEAVADYRLDRAELHRFRFERVGERLTGLVVLTAERRFPVYTAQSEPRLELGLEEVTDLALDTTRPAGPASVEVSADGEVELRLGPAGWVRGTGLTVYPHDSAWAFSAAGRAAAVDTGPDEWTGLPELGPMPSWTPAAGRLARALLHRTMLDIRTVRMTGSDDIPDVVGLCRALSGAGAELYALSRRPDEAAFRRLVEGWLERGGPLLTAVLADARTYVTLPAATEAWADGLAAPPAEPARRHPGADRVALRLVTYVPQPRYAAVQFAVPGADGGPWRMGAAPDARPGEVVLRAGAFHGTHPVAWEPDGSLLLGEELLRVVPGEAGPED